VNTCKSIITRTLFPDNEGHLYVDEPPTGYAVLVTARGQSVAYENNLKAKRAYFVEHVEEIIGVV